MVQPSTERDLTAPMERFSQRYLASVEDADGFILKSRSPSCGIRNAKLFHSGAEDAGHDSGPGLFTARVLERFPHAAVEDEGRLNDLRLRDHFLTKLWALASFRQATAAGPAALVDFHARNKLLLMAHNQTRMRALGRLVAQAGTAPRDALVGEYRADLGAALARPARPGNNVNVLMHALGHVSERLSARERKHFLATLDSYRAGRVPLGAARQCVGAWAARFEVPYLAGQTFFAPYPPRTRAARAPVEAPRRLTVTFFPAASEQKRAADSSQLAAVAGVFSKRRLREGGNAMDSRERDQVRSQLEGLADKGVTIGAIDSQLAGIPLNGDEYDEMWLYAWSLLEGRASRVVVQAGDWYGYAPVEGG